MEDFVAVHVYKIFLHDDILILMDLRVLEWSIDTTSSPSMICLFLAKVLM